MSLKYRATINCTLSFDIDADDEDHAQEIAEEILSTLGSGIHPSLLERAVYDPYIGIEDSYPDIHEN